MSKTPNLSCDLWRGVYCDSEDVDEPSWDQIEQAIQRLDEDQRTSVTLTYADGSHLSVGGGNGRFLVYIGPAWTEDEMYYTLIDPEKPEGAREELTIGGQAGIFPARQVVDLEMVLQATRKFFTTGRRDTDLTWVDE